jgi:ATP-dependent DNA ligase
MHPTLVRQPFHRACWVYEEKVDGWRILAFKDGDLVRLVSRHGVDHTKRFRGIAGGIHGRERAAGAVELRRGGDAVAGGAAGVGGGEPSGASTVTSGFP